VREGSFDTIENERHVINPRMELVFYNFLYFTTLQKRVVNCKGGKSKEGSVAMTARPCKM